MAAQKSNIDDWDPMKDDYNKSSHDAQYPDEDVGSSVQLDHRRLYITNIPPGLSEDGLRAAFSKFGTITQAFVSRDVHKRFALVKYETSGEAKVAMMKMNRTEPLKLSIAIAHKTKTANREHANGSHFNSREEDSISNGSRNRMRRQDNSVNGLTEMMEEVQPDDDIAFVDDEVDPNWNLEEEALRLQQLNLMKQELACKRRILLLKKSEKKMHTGGAVGRRILPDGRIEVRNNGDRTNSRDCDSSFSVGAGDSNDTTVCSCKNKKKPCQYEDEGSSTPTTCILCSEDTETRKLDKFELYDRETETTKKSNLSNATDSLSENSDVTSKEVDVKMIATESENDLKYNDLHDDCDEDETNKLILLRNTDYTNVVEDNFKLVLALAGYPKIKMRLQQMALFQKCLNDIINMQLKAGLLKRVPSFIDYYLNRGALVCICKDIDTRNWMVRVSLGLQERMSTNLELFRTKVKRLCLAILKIPKISPTSTAQDAFKLLQYFNPTINTHLWKIYSQKVVDDVEVTSLLIDRVSGEIIRGATFNNIVDYNLIDFELTGYKETYYESLFTGMEEDLRSVSSRVKLLAELKSEQPTANTSQVNVIKSEETQDETKDGESTKLLEVKEVPEDLAEILLIENSQAMVIEDESRKINIDHKQNVKIVEVLNIDMNKEFTSERDGVLAELEDADSVKLKDNLNWSEDANHNRKIDLENIEGFKSFNNTVHDTANVCPIVNKVGSEMSESFGSLDTLFSENSNFNVGSNKGIAYLRRTNYLDVENELKVAIILEGYPQNKLEGIHIKRLKHLFKEYLHKDVKNKRFPNLIIPKFQDVYLSNGAVIYICDSMKTRDYLSEILPKFTQTTGLKLKFKNVNDLVRYTRVVMRLPKEKSHLESIEILTSLQNNYPNLKPEYWKCYSNVVGKQKRQFGVDPESLKVIKSPEFDPIYEGNMLSFKIIDRKKRDISFSEVSQTVKPNDEYLKIEDVVKNMYAPLNPDIIRNSLKRVRTNHYNDLIGDDLKLFVSPSNFPETRIDDVLLHTFKKTIETIVFESYCKGDLNDETLPKFHDMYIFDGVIFVICQNMNTRVWLENAILVVNTKIDIQLKTTEFRGAVGIVSMVVQTLKSIDDVIATLQQQNPRLRTKYWRKISTVRSKTKIDAVLQIDKLSAEVISGLNFNKSIDSEEVQFALGHLKTLIKPKLTLEELTKKYQIKIEARANNHKASESNNLKEQNVDEINDNLIKYLPDAKSESEECVENIKESLPNSESMHPEKDNKDEIGNGKNDNNVMKSSLRTEHTTEKPHFESNIQNESDTEDVIINVDADNNNDNRIENKKLAEHKVIIKIPDSLTPQNDDELEIILDLLEEKNPGLKIIWAMNSDNYKINKYRSNGIYKILVDERSLSILKDKNFDTSIRGEKLKIYY